MEFLLIMGVMASLIAVWLAPPLVAVILIDRQRRALRQLQIQVEDLQAGLARLKQGPASDLAAGREPSVSDRFPASDPDAPDLPPIEDDDWRIDDPPRPARAWRPPSPERVILWVAAGLGGFALVLTAILALVAAVERGWLLPSVRVSAGLVGGIGAWAGGIALRRRSPWVGSALAGSGSGAVFAALWAGSSLYPLIPREVAGPLMVAAVVLGMLQAARYSDRVLAWLALLGGLLTPVLLSTGENRPVAYFAYLTLLASGAVGAAAYRGWPALIAGTALGVGALHVGWTAGWYVADQALYGLAGALALTLPFAAAAATRPRAVHLAGAVGAVALSLLALPWLLPVGTTFHDPFSYEVVARPLHGADRVIALFLALFPIAPWLAGRWRGHLLGGVAGSLVATALPLTFALSWSVGAEPSSSAMALAAVGPLLAGALVTAGHPASSRGLLPIPAVAGVVAAVGAAGSHLVGLPFAGAVGAIAFLGLLLARTGPWGWLLPPTLVGVALPLWAADPEVVGLSWMLAPTLLAVGLLSQVPLLLRWDPRDRAPLATAALTGVVLLFPLYALWRTGWGDAVLGLLPVGLAANALLATLLLVRTRRVRRNDWLLGLFVGVVLLGLSAALPMQLQERWLTVAWAIEVAALAAISHRVTHPLVRAFAMALAVVVGVRLLLNPWALSWGDASGLPVLNWTLYSWGVPLVCLLVAARVWPAPGSGSLEGLLRRGPALFSSLAVLVGFALINVQVSEAFQDAGPIELGGHSRLEGMVRSISWAAYGLLLLGMGALRDHRIVRFVGFAFLLLTAMKVFLVDLWDLSGFARVGSIGGLALTLIVAAFLFERLVRGSRPAPEET